MTETLGDPAFRATVADGIRTVSALPQVRRVRSPFVAGNVGQLSQHRRAPPSFGLAATILIDSTVVRAVLLPAVMKLLGEWNWYLPRWLEWLPRVDSERDSAQRSRHRRPLAEAAPAWEYE